MTLSTLVALLLVAAPEALPPGTKLVRITAHPAAVRIDGPYAYTQLVLTGTTATGEPIDVTRLAAWTVPPAVKVGLTGQVRPLADGKGAITARVAGLEVAIPVEVSHLKSPKPASFIRDVMPILARLGCNQGTCHGAEAGRAGFKLSLRGYDPLFDHRALTDDLGARRTNRASPAQSLMLLKISGAVPHPGGVLTQSGEPYYEILKAWIAAGHQFDGKTAKVKSIEVFPANAVLGLPGYKQQLAVTARYADGTSRDVTAEAFLVSSNTEVATVDRAATVLAIRRGETTVTARYEGAYAAATLIVMGDRTGFAWKAAEGNNWIDTLVYDKLKQVKVLPSDLCTDSEFIRRAYIDLTGTLPTAEATRAFLADRTPSRARREKLIDSLVGNNDFIEHWTNKWADLLQVNRKFLGEPGARAFRAYIREAVAKNKPYDKFVHDVLTARGSNVASPAASYYKVLRTPDAVMENTTQLFLGVRFNCNKCHDHPFEKWTQDQYYELAAYFARVSRKEDPAYKGKKVGGSAVEGAKPLVEVIGDAPSGEFVHVRTNVPMPPAFPYPLAGAIDTKATRREQVAAWITSPKNSYFARSYVNRLWAYLLGAGIIEPIDDIRAGNPPTNPRLLDRLTEEFIKSGFDTRHILKLIAKSRTYQHSVASSKWNQDDSVNYSHALARRLPAEVLYDAIHRATGSISHLPGLPPGARASMLLDSRQDAPGGFLDQFGKPPRESACECERVGGVQLGPVLTLVNGPVVGEAVRDPANKLAELLRKEKDTSKIVEELYLSFLSRRPTPKETAAALAAIKAGEEDYNESLAEHNKRQAELNAYEKTLAARMPAWEAAFARRAVWKPVTFVKGTARGKGMITAGNDGALRVTGPTVKNELYTLVLDSELPLITGIRLEALTDKSLGAMGPGRAPNGNFVLHEVKVSALEKGKKGKPGAVALVNAQATFSQAGFNVAGAIDNNLGTGWAIAPQMGKPQTALFQFKTPVKNAGGTQLTITLDQRYGQRHSLGKFRISVTGTPGRLSLKGAPAHLAAILAIEPSKRSAAQRATLEAAFKAQDVELTRLRGELAKAGLPVDRRHPGVQDLAWALINSKAFQFNH